MLPRNEPWAIAKDALPGLLQAAALYAKDPRRPPIKRRTLDAASYGASPRGQGAFMVNRVAVVPILVPLFHRTGPLIEMLGGVGMEAMALTIDRLAEDHGVDSLLLIVDRPGGTVAGAGELADRIRLAAQKKRVVALADTCMASAALWFCAGATEIVATAAAQVGSVGCIAVHEDISGALDKEGVRLIEVSFCEQGKNPAAVAILATNWHRTAYLGVGGSARDMALSRLCELGQRMTAGAKSLSA